MFCKVPFLSRRIILQKLISDYFLVDSWNSLVLADSFIECSCCETSVYPGNIARTPLGWDRMKRKLRAEQCCLCSWQQNKYFSLNPLETTASTSDNLSYQQTAKSQLLQGGWCLICIIDVHLQAVWVLALMSVLFLHDAGAVQAGLWCCYWTLQKAD